MSGSPETAPQPTFYGNAEDLNAFLRLASSQPRSEERENALHEWEAYKARRQVQYVGSQAQGKRGHWKKSDYIKSLTAPAIDLRGAVFTDICLGYADLRGARLDDARFETGTSAWFALKGANLQRASLRNAQLAGARLMDADLRYADLSGADLSGADLTGANMIGADLRGTRLSGARVYGVAAWDIKSDDDASLQRDLIVTQQGQPEVTADNIEVAQFIYLLLMNEKIRAVIDTVCKKGVLILGRFTLERKKVLDTLRDELRRLGYVPMLFDFKKPTQRDFTETVRTLAGMCRFIIADITNPRSSPLELMALVPDYQIPFVPIIADGEQPFSMFADLQQKYHWVLNLVYYESVQQLVAVFEPAIIRPALKKHAELLAAKAESIRIRRASDYLGE